MSRGRKREGGGGALECDYTNVLQHAITASPKDQAADGICDPFPFLSNLSMSCTSRNKHLGVMQVNSEDAQHYSNTYPHLSATNIRPYV